MIKSIRKRDGRLVDFEVDKIAGALYKAFSACFDKVELKKVYAIAHDVEKRLEEKESTLPTVELVQDTVEEIDIQIDISDMTRSLLELIKKIDRISGTNFKPVKVFINGIEDYAIGQMRDYKHLVVKPTDYIYLIKWNFDGDFEEMEDHALMNDEIEVIGNLDSGFFGRKFVLKTICDEIKVIA